MVVLVAAGGRAVTLGVPCGLKTSIPAYAGMTMEESAEIDAICATNSQQLKNVSR